MSRRSSHEGCIVRRKDGRWQASLQVNGRRRTVYGRTRQEAAARLDGLKRQVAEGGLLPDPGRRTLGDLLDAWIDARAPRWKPRTLHDYQATCERLRLALGNVRLGRLTSDRIERYLAQLHETPRQALKCYRALSQALTLAVRWNWLTRNPCERVDTPKYRPRRKDVWMADQLRAFLDGTRNHWLGPLWALLAFSGSRLGEATALEWPDVDLPGHCITISKSVQRIAGEWVTTAPKTPAGVRTIGIPREAADALRRQADWRMRHGAGRLVFTAPSGEPLHGNTVCAAMRRECERLRLPPVTPHGLRHLHASLLLTKGLPLAEVSRRLGHANAAITAAVYTHAVRDDRQAVELLERVL